MTYRLVVRPEVDADLAEALLRVCLVEPRCKAPGYLECGDLSPLSPAATWRSLVRNTATAKRLSPPAQSCRFGYPGFALEFIEYQP